MKKSRGNPDLEPIEKSKENYPTRTGVYLVSGAWGDMEPRPIDVYVHPRKGLCCFSQDFQMNPPNDGDEANDCHVSVQFTGLEFISRVGNLPRRVS